MRKLFFSSSLFKFAAATLTKSGTVTASSYDPTTPASRVVDGSFAISDSCANCAGCFSTLLEPGAAWINVQLAHPALVQTVIVVNDEDAIQITNLSGSQIRVGFDPLPINNKVCSTVNTSGHFTCPPGTLGLYVGIYNPNMNGKSLKLCELRAYPWLANALVDTIFATNQISGFPAENALTFTDNIQQDLCAKNNKQIDGRYRYNLSAVYFVYAAILIGDPQNDFKNTKDWYVTAGTDIFSLNNPSVVAYQSEQDRFGLEIVIGWQASVVAFIRTTKTEQFNTVFGGVFASTKDCSTITFNWTDLAANSPYRFPLLTTPTTQIINLSPGTDAACYLYMKVTNVDDTAIPTFMTVNTINTRLEILPSLISQKGTYDLKVFASYWDNVGPYKSATQTFKVIILCADSISVDPATQISSPQIYTIGNPKVLLNLPTYKFLPVDAQVNFTFTLSGAPSFVIIVNGQIQIQTNLSSNKGVYNIVIDVRETISGLTASTSFQLTAACDQSFTQTSTQADIFYVVGSPSVVKTLPAYAVVSDCPPSIQYSLHQADGSNLPAGLAFNPDPAVRSLTIFTADNTLSATFNLVLKISDSGTLQYNDSTRFKVRIYCIQGLQPTSTLTSITYIIDHVNSTQKNPQTQTWPSPQYVGTPAQCPEALVYSLVLTQITAKQTPFLTYSQAAGISIYTNELAFVDDYQFKFTATDSVSGAVSVDMIFLLSIVCRPQTLALQSGKILDQTYILASSQIVLPVPIYTLTPTVCLHLAALSMVLDDVANPGSLPTFISPAAPTTVVNISSSDISFAQQSFTFKFRAQIAADLAIYDEFTFKVSVECDVLALNVVTPFSGAIVTYLIDAGALTPLSIQLPVYQASPACSNTFTYAFVQNPAFISINAPNLVVATSDISLRGLYTFTLSATESLSLLSNTSQTLKLLLRCSTATFSFSASIQDFNYSIEASAVSQPIPRRVVSPSMCEPDIVFQIINLDGLLTPWISPMNPISGDLISVFTMDSTQVGTFNFRLAAYDLKGAELASTTFKVQIACVVLQIVVVSGGVINPIKYTVSQGAIINYTFAAPTYTWSPQVCPQNLQTQVLRLDNMSTNLQSFISWNDATREVKIGTNDSNLVGQYAFIFQTKDLLSGLPNTQVTFYVDILAYELTIDSNPISSVFYSIVQTETPQTYTIPLPQYNTNMPASLSYEIVLLSFQPFTGVRRLQVAAFPTFITQYPTTSIVLNTNDASLAGMYYFKLVATETFSNVSNDEIRFTVTLTCQITDLKPIYDSRTLVQTTYTIGEQSLTFSIPKYEAQPKGCWTGNLQYSLQGLVIPSFISLDQTAKKIKLSGGKSDEGRKEYQFKIVASNEDIVNSDYTFTVSTYIVNQAPEFETTLKDIYFSIGDTYPSWNLPPIHDQENDQIKQIQVSKGSAKDWLIFDFLSTTFSISTSALIEPGTFPIQVSLMDSANSKRIYTFNVIVLTPVSSTEESNPKNENEVLEILLEKPDASTFAETYDFMYREGDTKVYSNKDTVIRIEPLYATITKLDMKGQFKVIFSDLVFKLVPDLLKSLEILKVDITWQNTELIDSSAPKPIYQWRALNMTNYYIEIKVDFEKPLLISQGKTPDIINVHFNKRTYFRRRTDNEALNTNSILLTAPIPKQAPNIEEAVRIEETLNQFQGISGTTLFILAFYGLMNLPKSLFWSMHGTIQFIVYEPQHGGEYPGNVLFMYDLLNKLANMTFDKAQEWNRKIFNIKLPKGTQNVFVDAGIFILGIVVCCVGICFFLAIRKPLQKCSWGRYVDGLVATEIRRTLMFSTPLRFAQLAYMFIVVKSWSAVAGGKQQILFQSKGEAVNSIIFYMLFVYSIVYPICVTIFLMVQGPVGLARYHIIEKFRSLYLDLQLHSRLTLMVTVNFLIRRAIVGISIALLGNYYGFQLIILLLACFYVFIYDISVMPFNTVQLNMVELLNEGFLLSSVYMLHVFSDFVPDEVSRYKFGWYYVYVVFSVFIVNILVIGGVMLYDLYGIWRKYWKKRSLKIKIQKVLAERRRRKAAGDVQKNRRVVSIVRNHCGFLDEIRELPSQESRSESSEEESSSSESQLEIESVIGHGGDGTCSMEQDSRPANHVMRLLTNDSGEVLETNRPLLVSKKITPGFESPRQQQNSNSIFYQNRRPKNFVDEESKSDERSDAIKIIEEEDVFEKPSFDLFKNEPEPKKMPSTKFERFQLQNSSDEEKQITQPVIGSIDTSVICQTPKELAGSETRKRSSTHRSIQSAIMSPNSNPYCIASNRSRRFTDPNGNNDRQNTKQDTPNELSPEKINTVLKSSEESLQAYSIKQNSNHVHKQSIRKLKQGLEELTDLFQNIKIDLRDAKQQELQATNAEKQQMDLLQIPKNDTKIKMVSQQSTPTGRTIKPHRLFATESSSPGGIFRKQQPQGGSTRGVLNFLKNTLTKDTFKDEEKEIKFNQHNLEHGTFKESIYMDSKGGQTPWSLDLPVPESTPIHIYYPQIQTVSSPDFAGDRSQSVAAMSNAQSIKDKPHSMSQATHPLDSRAQSSNMVPIVSPSPRIIKPDSRSSFVFQNPIHVSTVQTVNGSAESIWIDSVDDEEKYKNTTSPKINISIQNNEKRRINENFKQSLTEVYQTKLASPKLSPKNMQKFYMLKGHQPSISFRISPNLDQIKETQREQRRNTQDKRNKKLQKSVPYSTEGKQKINSVRNSRREFMRNQASQILSSRVISNASIRSKDNCSPDYPV